MATTTTNRINSQLVGVLDVYITQYGAGGALYGGTPFADVAVSVADIDTSIAGNNPLTGWYKLGPTDGEQAISHGGGLTYFRDNSGTGPTKAVRPEEDLTVTFTVVGLSLENYVFILSGATVSTVGAVKTIGLTRGLVPQQFALLLRGTAISPYGAYRGQYVFPRGVFDGEPNPTFSKDGRAELEVEYHVIEDPTQTEALKFGWFEVRTS